MTRFVVDLGNIELSETATRELDAAIKTTVMSRLADMQLREPLVVKFPNTFPWGIIIGPDLDMVRETEKFLQVRLG